MFCPTVIEDVSFGPLNIGHTPKEAEEIAQAALEGFGIAHLAQRISHKLSGGEKRLVCLAGLFAMSPDVLLLDEPSNGIDRAQRRTPARCVDAFHRSDGAGFP
ncbi:MAG: ATP-binding cassette domain-containing protein [Breoghania sp.]|nr:ATP-binding cassette domain-containing protein [Breoghania sp.]MDJ0933288.1 ATP-binding cassette domain-containing protein [Breoghania sp.]